MTDDGSVVQTLQNDDYQAQILKIMTDESLTTEEKAKRRQQLMAQQWGHLMGNNEEDIAGSKGNCSGENSSDKENQPVDDEELNCVICMSCCQKPVTIGCQHSFCLKCFKRWAQQDRNCKCPTCRAPISRDMIINPRINTLLAMAIRFGKQGQHEKKRTMQREYRTLKDDKKDRPDKAYQTERAKKTGMANAASGRMMVTMNNYHFGPITAEMDTTRGLGVRVGDWWKYRLDAYQWGVHMNHVGGISGQARLGAQSVVISGGYEDDLDEGDWFLYTGSGGRDLSGNKRTNKKQSFDQEFKLYNESLRQSCLAGLPVRVLRSVKEKRSAYAPPLETPLRYDGLYRVMACWRKTGAQGLLMCRYFFVRSDNEAAPWAEDEGADKPMEHVPPEAQEEMDNAAQGKVWRAQGKPYWDYDAEQQQWVWTREAPTMPIVKNKSTPKPAKPRPVKINLKNFKCGICKETMNGPIVTPCGHNFCKDCISAKFEGLGDEEVPKVGRKLRSRKVNKPCPTCSVDLAEFLKNLQVNRDIERFILKAKQAQENESGEIKEEEQEEEGAQKEQTSSQDIQDLEDDKNTKKQKSTSQQQIQTAANVDISNVANNLQASESDKQNGIVMEDQETNMLTAEEIREQQMKELKEAFPMFEEDVIGVILEDNEGDVGAVGTILKRMRNQLKYQSNMQKRNSENLEAPKKAQRGRKRKTDNVKKEDSAQTNKKSKTDDENLLGDVALNNDDDDFVTNGTDQ
eukprot:TRINITY_DN4378_c0_g1_i1.p1 TRINITY_DN4378_c0_g1~~TRINITY_DN4378_c0_g1_i1.p1  ORF type:complete len:786 (-),score=106.64 TRINITY_DN4378_c0_g1_i1:1320-3545(-)